MRNSALAPGKRLRPALCLASCEAVGGAQTAALDAACAIELIHCFSLIHDDLPALDNDDLRRGRATLHVAYGEAVAILAGDAIFSLAFEVVAKSSLPSKLKVEIFLLLTQAAGTDGLVAGETADILAEGQEVDFESLEFIHAKKTGSLISAACRIGALVGSENLAWADALEAYGRDVGLAFQIADDVLNETSTPEQLGKAAGSDRDRKKATYPALIGLEASQQKAASLIVDALKHLQSLPGSTTFLEELAKFSVSRGR
jgi:geranylgeranyl diphosphate synthase type II